MSLEKRFQETEIINSKTQQLSYERVSNKIRNIQALLVGDDERIKYIKELCELTLYYLDKNHFEFTTFFTNTNDKFREYEKYFDEKSDNEVDKLFFELNNLNLEVSQIIIEEIKTYQSNLPLIINCENEVEDKVADRKDLQEIENLMDSI